MNTRANRIPLFLEFTLVLGMTYGLVVIPAIWRAATQWTLAPMVFSNWRMGSLVMFQLSTGGLALMVLRFNGWRRSELEMDCGLLDVGMSILLFLSAMATHFLAVITIRAISPDSSLFQFPSMSGHLSLPILLLVCVINPLFEEGILLGYILKALRPQGFSVACGIGLLFRLSTHLYQGPLAVLSILPLGLIFASFYWKTNRLWPVVFAHMLLDLLPLLRTL
jgi:membrane protease YdiL (CAAX protease family)